MELWSTRHEPALPVAAQTNPQACPGPLRVDDLMLPLLQTRKVRSTEVRVLAEWRRWGSKHASVAGEPRRLCSRPHCATGTGEGRCPDPAPTHLVN